MEFTKWLLTRECVIITSVLIIVVFEINQKNSQIETETIPIVTTTTCELFTGRKMRFDHNICECTI